MKTITLHMLEYHGACREQRDLFESIFGDSVDITVELVIKYSDKFDIQWCAEELLNYTARAEYFSNIPPVSVAYNIALDAAADLYNMQCKPARKICDAEIADALAVYDNVRAGDFDYNEWTEARKTFDIVWIPAMERRNNANREFFDALKKQRNELTRNYEKAKAELFARAFLSMPEPAASDVEILILTGKKEKPQDDPYRP